MKHSPIKVFVAISFLGIVFFLVSPTPSFGAEKNAGCQEENIGFWKGIGCVVENGINVISGIFDKKEFPPSNDFAPFENKGEIINETTSKIIADAEFRIQEFQSVRREYQEAKTIEEKSEVLTTFVATVESRKKSMEALMEENPSEFLLRAISKEERAELPLEVQKNIEEEIKFSGSIQTVHYDDFANKKSHEEYFILSGNERLRFFPVGLESPVVSQTKVRVEGFRLDNRIVAAVNDKNFSLVGNLSLDALGPQKTLILLVNFLDSGTPPFSLEEAKKLVFDGQAQKFFKDQSYEKTYFEGDVFGWYTYQKNSTGSIWINGPEFADMIKKNNINLKKYDHVVFIAHGNLGGGWSTVRKIENIIDGVSYEFSVTFVGGGYESNGFFAPSTWGKQPFPWTNLDYVLAHELGHALGVLHANSMECPDGFILNGPGCRHVEYGNYFDVMGTNSYSLSFNALFKEILGWLDNNSIQTISTPGRYELHPIENKNGVRGMKIKIKGSDETAFYLEYRRGIGFDVRLDESSFNSNQNGLFINKYIDLNGDAFPRLLDMTPSFPLSSWDRVTLNKEMGIFSDSVSGITVGPIVSADNEKIVFDVGFNEPQCTESYPVITQNNENRFISGTNFYLLFNVQNTSPKKCLPATFVTSLSLPDGCRVENIQHEDDSRLFVSGSTFSIRGGERKNVQIVGYCPLNIEEGVYNSTFSVNHIENPEKTAKSGISFFLIKRLSAELSSDSPVSQKIEKGEKKFSLLKFNIKNNSKYFGYNISAFSVRFLGLGVTFDILKDGQVLKENEKLAGELYNASVSIPQFNIGSERTTSFEIRASVDQDAKADKIRAEILGIQADPYVEFSELPIYGNWMYFNDVSIVPTIVVTQPSSEITLQRGEKFNFMWEAKNFLSPNDPVSIDVVSGKDGEESNVILPYGGGFVGFIGNFIIDTSWFPPDGIYRMRVREQNSGITAFSNRITLKTLPLATPTHFVAWHPYTDAGTIKNITHLNWYDVSSAEDGFEIWRSIDNGEFSLFPDVEKNITYAIDSISSSTSWTTLQYKIRAYKTEVKCSPWVMPLEYLKLRIKRVFPCDTIKTYSDFSPITSPDVVVVGMGNVVLGNDNIVRAGEARIPLKDLLEIHIRDRDGFFSVKGLTKDEIVFFMPLNSKKTTINALFTRNEKIYQEAWKMVE